MMVRSVAAKLGRALGAALLACASCACSGATTPDENTITIGLLLPFTGSSSATSANLERAVLFAVDQVNAGGGVKARKLQILSRDTHSDVKRGKQAAQELIDGGAVVVIGPESDEIARAIIPMLTARDIVLLSPFVGAANDATVDCTHPWFRLAPSARTLGEALAKQAVVGQNLHRVALLYAATSYDQALGNAVRARVQTLGGVIPFEARLDPDAEGYASAVMQLSGMAVDAVVLTASPRAGALIVDEYGALSAAPPRWFLSPLLKTDVFVQNVAPEALAAAQGVAPKIYDTSSAFPTAFGQRWQGDQPLEGAYFYYDAIGVVAIALERTTPDEKGRIALSDLEASIAVSATPDMRVNSEAVRWDQIAVGVQRQHDGANILYSGLTGPLIIDACGARTNAADGSAWEVLGGTIVTPQ